MQNNSQSLSTKTSNFSTVLDSKKVQKYTKKHKESKRISDLYTVVAYNYGKANQETYLKKADAIRNCNKSLFCFYDTETKENHLMSIFCKQRFCPICAYNEELKNFKIFSEIVNHEKTRGKKWIFLTLTIKNAEYHENDVIKSINDLKEAVKTILKGFNHLTSNKEKSFLGKHSLGMLRSLEITKKHETFHPHLHVLMCVDSSYGKISGNWITKDDLIKHWRKVCNLNYDPSVDIQYVDTDQKTNAVAEVAKYQTKSNDIKNAEMLYILDSVLTRTRVRGYTGIIKELRSEIEKKLETEKIDVKKIILDRRFIKALFTWDSFNHSFRYNIKESNRLNMRIEQEIKDREETMKLAEECLKLQDI